MTRRKPPENHKPLGRPSDYSPDYDGQAYRLALLKLTDKEIAEFFEVSEVTLNAWKKKHPSFLKSLTRGKTFADAKVAEKFLERAMGYSHEAVKIFMPAGAKEPVVVPYREHYPPDTNAISLWLRNRQPARWRDKVEGDDAGDEKIEVEGGLPAAEAGPELPSPFADEGS